MSGILAVAVMGFVVAESTASLAYKRAALRYVPSALLLGIGLGLFTVSGEEWYTDSVVFVGYLMFLGGLVLWAALHYKYDKANKA